MKEFFKKVKSAVNTKALAFAAIIAGALGVVSTTHAATDPDLQALSASTTSLLSDNKGLILTYMFGIFAVVIVIVIAARMLGLGKNQIGGAIGHKSGRRR